MPTTTGNCDKVTNYNQWGLETYQIDYVYEPSPSPSYHHGPPPPPRHLLFDTSSWTTTNACQAAITGNRDKVTIDGGLDSEMRVTHDLNIEFSADVWGYRMIGFMGLD